MYRYRRNSQDRYCGACGKLWSKVHRCPEGTMRAIDSANTRAWDAEFRASDDPWYFPTSTESDRQDYHSRLQKGYRMLYEGDLSDICTRCEKPIRKCYCESPSPLRLNPDPQGDCFRWALMEALSSGILCHGWVLNQALLKRGVDDYTAHAWAERDGLVYDWQRCEKNLGICPIPKEEFEERYQPQGIVYYKGSPKLLGKAYQEGHYGPWHSPPWSDPNWSPP